MSKPTHQQCGFCRSQVPYNSTECPFCHESLEGYGAPGAFVESLLPEDRPMTRATLAVIAGIFAIVGIAAGGMNFLAPSAYTTMHFGATYAPMIWEGQWWRFWTGFLLHADLVHLGFNAYGLWIVGPLIENTFGKIRYLSALILTGLASTLTQIFWTFYSPELYHMIPGLDASDAGSFSASLVGISGALTGFIGMGIAAGHKVQNEQGTRIRNAMLQWMGFIIVSGLLIPEVSNAAHIGGFLLGLGLGYVWPLKNRAGKTQGMLHLGLATALLVSLCAAVGMHAANLPREYPSDVDLYPTAIFGQKIRDFNEKSAVFSDTERACNGAIKQYSLDESNKGALQKTLKPCDKLAYIGFPFPEARLRSAILHLEAGDHELGCTRLRTTYYTVSWGSLAKNPETQDIVKTILDVAQEKGCDL